MTIRNLLEIHPNVGEPTTLVRSWPQVCQSPGRLRFLVAGLRGTTKRRNRVRITEASTLRRLDDTFHAALPACPLYYGKCSAVVQEEVAGPRVCNTVAGRGRLVTGGFRGHRRIDDHAAGAQDGAAGRNAAGVIRATAIAVLITMAANAPSDT